MGKGAMRLKGAVAAVEGSLGAVQFAFRKRREFKACLAIETGDRRSPPARWLRTILTHPVRMAPDRLTEFRPFSGFWSTGRPRDIGSAP